MLKNFELDILHFVLTGNFCNIDLGITKNKLISIGLKPDYWLNEKSVETSAIWGFGNIEFHFDETNKLTSIFSDSVSHKLDGGKNIQIINYWLLKRRKISLKKTIEELLSLKIDFNKILVNPGFIELRLNNGVFFAFDFVNDLNDNHNIWTMTAFWKGNVKL